MKLGDTVEYKGVTLVLVEDKDQNFSSGCPSCYLNDDAEACADYAGCLLNDAHWEKQPIDLIDMDFSEIEERAMTHMMTTAENITNTDKMMSSLTIAELTEKRHADVMRDIRKLIDQEVIRECNFALSSYTQEMPRGGYKTIRTFDLDFESTMVLVTGYDAHRRMAVIKEWNHLRQQPAVPSIGTEQLLADPDLIIGLATQVKQIKAERDHAVATKAWISSKKAATSMGRLSGAMRKLRAIERENEELKQKVESEPTHMTTKAIPWFHQYFLPLVTAHQQLGKELTKLSTDMGLSITKVPNEEYGEIKAYSLQAIDLMKQRLDLFPLLLKKYRKK